MNQLNAAEFNSQKKKKKKIAHNCLIVVDDLFPPKLRLFNRRKIQEKQLFLQTKNIHSSLKFEQVLLVLIFTFTDISASLHVPW